MLCIYTYSVAFPSSVAVYPHRPIYDVVKEYTPHMIEDMHIYLYTHSSLRPCIGLSV